MSQLSLAMRAGFSARHVSFIETGRAQPSRQAVLVLAEALDVPLRERNRLLGAAGYAEVFRQTPLGAEEMHHVHGVLEFILERHEPYGAVVLDRYSNLLDGQRSGDASPGWTRRFNVTGRGAQHAARRLPSAWGAAVDRELAGGGQAHVGKGGA